MGCGMKNIVTVCRQGLVRSVGLADVLKLHFEPVDVIPVGIASNTGSLPILFAWADHIIVMEEKYKERIPEEFKNKVKVCEVGPDTYGHGPRRAILIDMVWRWARENQELLGITEHNKVL